MPAPRGTPVMMTCFVDADHAGYQSGANHLVFQATEHRGILHVWLDVNCHEDCG